MKFLTVNATLVFQQNLGLSRQVLSDRLSHLVDHGVLERGREYRLTDRGRALYPVLLALMRWGDEWLAHAQGPPVRLEHRGCGRNFHARTVCSECGHDLTPDQVRAKAGPGLLGWS